MRALSPDLRRLFVNLGPLITASKTGLPAIRDVLVGAKPLLGSLGPFLEQLNPILNWLSLHQQLISDFISNGAYGIAAKTVAFGGGGIGHYLRQFSPVGPETLSFSPTRDANNRGNTYPSPLWLADPQVMKLSNLPVLGLQQHRRRRRRVGLGDQRPGACGPRGVLGRADAAGRFRRARSRRSARRPTRASSRPSGAAAG